MKFFACCTFTTVHEVSIACVLLLLAAQADGGVTFTLEGLLQTARENDGRVREADSQLRVLKGKYDEARWAWFPRLELSVLLAGPTPEARNDGLGGPPTTKASLLYDADWGTP